ncbi:citramalate synthase [Pseudonocardia xishanensis]|uniref:Hydroxymethylglutaryl-CoA lyase n=1 Tax=Pseudonocardia xishanensis TaxID=630995 RepID=A0ABP8RUE6_9PSEU
MTRGLPTVRIVEEALREGVQIERVGIETAAKVELLDALSATGLDEIVVGSFVRGDWVPQMAHVEEVIERMTVVPGVRYRALVLNDKGAARRDRYVPPLSVDASPRLTVHACDVFAQRNTNRGQAAELAGLTAAADRVGPGEEPATVRVNAAFGSNYLGDVEPELVLGLIARMMDVWERAGRRVDTVWLGDPMGWNTPLGVEHLVTQVIARWPHVRRVHLHLHDQRGAALVSAYAAIRALGAEHELVLDAAVGGVGGCPYCGNGRAAGMIATEDLVDMLQEMGIPTGIDLDRLVEAAVLAETVFGHPLYGKVALAGPRPRGDRLYPMDMPLVETVEEAAHYRLGPEAYAGGLRPWRRPVASPQRARAERGEPVVHVVEPG